MAITTLDRHIAITPGIANGKPHIAGHRITVQNVVALHELVGLSVDEIASEYGLSLSDIHSALAFYYDNRTEFDAAIQEDELFADALRQKIPSKLTQKLLWSKK